MSDEQNNEIELDDFELNPRVCNPEGEECESCQ